MPPRADDRDDGFFTRWARRKAEARRGVADEPPPAAAPSAAAQVAGARTDAPAVPAAAPTPAVAPAPVRAAAAAPAAPGTAEAADAPPAPTMDDVARLTRGSDFSRFVRAGVDEDVKRAALKKLFADPHFNVMDGLDVYIDDYGKPDPLPASMLRKMVQSKALGLFADEPPAGTTAATAAAATDAAAAPPPAVAPPPASNPAPAPVAAEASTDEDADLRLQPLDAAGREGDPRDAGVDAGREC